MSQQVLICGSDLDKAFPELPWADFLARELGRDASLQCRVRRIGSGAFGKLEETETDPQPAGMLIAVCSSHLLSEQFYALLKDCGQLIRIAFVVGGDGPVESWVANYDFHAAIDGRHVAGGGAGGDPVLHLLNTCKDLTAKSEDAPKPAVEVSFSKQPASKITMRGGEFGSTEVAESSATQSTTDRVTFAAFVPARIGTGTTFVLDVWAHTAAQGDAVAKLAAELGRGSKVGVKAGVGVKRGTELGVILEIPTLRIADSSENMVWEGEPVNASFAVEVPKDAATGRHAGRAVITVSGIPITRLIFSVEVSSGTGGPAGAATIEERPIRTAFASYSSRDRAEVLARVQGMKAIRPDLVIFLDVLSLRPGQNWESEIRRHVQADDAFFLFWSAHAKASTEVEKEWRTALEVRGIEFIGPVPLADPTAVSPPSELQALHFNDYYLAHIKASRDRQRAANKPWWRFW
jgi:hypothetical protein